MMMRNIFSLLLVRRYGVAYNAEIFVGKVFDNRPRPSAPTRSILAGIEWQLLMWQELLHSGLRQRATVG
jgi:hypothetical protein